MNNSYISNFDTTAELATFSATTQFMRPHVSFTKDNDEVHYFPRFFCKLKLSDGSVVEIEGNGVLTSAMAKPYSATTVSAEIGDLCTSIGSSAFSRCNNLTSVTIGTGVTSIDDYAFDSCISLTSINIPSGVTSIGTMTFRGCSLTSIDIPNSVTSIGSSAFQSCSGLTSVTIPDSVTSIGSRAFQGCKSLTSVTIPDSVTSIGSSAFYGCSNLTSITSNATTAPTIDSSTFYYVKTGGTLYVPAGSTGYDVWMGTGNYYLGMYGWTKVEQ